MARHVSVVVPPRPRGRWVLHACVWPGVFLPTGVGLSLVVLPRLSEGGRRHGASHDAAYPCLGGLGYTLSGSHAILMLPTLRAFYLGVNASVPKRVLNFMMP